MSTVATILLNTNVFGKSITKCPLSFLDDTKMSTEVENAEGFDQDVGGEDEFGTYTLHRSATQCQMFQ